MNNENQTNQNPNMQGPNGGNLDPTALGSVSNPAPSEPTPMPNPTGPVMPSSPVNNDVSNPVMPEEVAASPASQTEAPLEATPTVGEAVAPVVNTPEVNANPAMPDPTPVMPANNGAVNPEVSSDLNSPTPVVNNPEPVAMEPIAQPIPGTNGSYTANTNNNVNSNGFVASQKVANVGMDVPSQEEKKPKKGINKIVFILIIVALLAAIAYGVYYYLTLGQSATSKITVNPQNLEFEANSTLPTDLTEYATFSGTDAKNCDLNTDEVDMTTAGTYEYTITCGKDVFKGNIVVINNSTLSASIKDVFAPVTTGDMTNNLTVENFVVADSCTAEDCTYAFAEDFDLNASLSQAGTYTVPIMVTDSNGNSNRINASLIVIDDFKVLFTYSTTADNMKITDKLAINNSNIFTGNAIRLYEFTFADAEEYNNVTSNKPETITYNDITGRAAYDDENKILTIKMDLTSDILNSEFNGTFPTAFAEINEYYVTNKGYTFSMER